MHIEKKRNLVYYTHIGYILYLIFLFVAYVLYPVYAERSAMHKASYLKTVYNKKLDTLILHSQIDSATEQTLKKLREMIVQYRYVDSNEVEECVNKLTERKESIEKMYEAMKKEMERPKKRFLYYSSDCRAGVFCSFLFPLAIVSLTNVKALYQ